jgi:hypothetical protein
MNVKPVTLALALSTLLAACGGGSGSNNAQAPATPDAGGGAAARNAVDAPFMASDHSRYIYLGNTGQVLGVLNGFTQDESGAVTKLGSTTLGGAPVVVDISGNASFAMGRWSGGTVTTSSGSSELKASAGDAMHYLVYNTLPAMPAAGSLTCSTGNFTSSTDKAGSSTSPDSLGAASGSATIVVDALGAHITMKLANKLGSDSAEASYTGDFESPTVGIFKEGYLTNTQGAYIALADAGGGAVRLVTSYRLLLSNGLLYQGVATFACR